MKNAVVEIATRFQVQFNFIIHTSKSIYIIYSKVGIH